MGKTKRGKGTKLLAIADRHGLPIAAGTESASPAENTLVASTLEARLIAEVPERLIGDKAYDSDGLDRELKKGFGTEAIAPHRSGRRPETKTQDGRSLRRFQCRWKVERLFAWLGNFRRLIVRWEYHAENFQGFGALGLPPNPVTAFMRWILGVLPAFVCESATWNAVPKPSLLM